MCARLYLLGIAGHEEKSPNLGDLVEHIGDNLKPQNNNQLDQAEL